MNAKNLLLLVSATLLLAGCGATPLLHVTKEIANLGQELPPDMVKTNVAAYVGFDEAYAGDYNRSARATLYVQGIVEGTPEYHYRVARINLTNTGENFFVEKGRLTTGTGAIVPDHIPQLKAGDIVEVRQTGTWRTMENFSVKKEGNIVVRILCRKESPDYEACKKAGPSVGKYAGVGATGTPYPASIAEYGFSFTPFYDKEGKALRAWPTQRQ